MREFSNIIILIFFLTLSLSGLFATSQDPDVLIFNGEKLSLFANPLEQFEKIDSLRAKDYGIKKGCWSTACWRGYQAEWEIIDNQLYLNEIHSCCFSNDSIKANLENLFGNKCINGKVKADWVTAELIVPKGKLIYYIHENYQSIYEMELGFKFEKGQLIEIKQYDNSKTKESVYSKDTEKLRKFIYSNINWTNLPEVKEKGVRVIVQFSANENGIIDSVTVIRGDNDIFNKEAIRIIKTIPEWNVYFRHGKYLGAKWSYVIIFNQENKEKYNIK